MRLVYRRPGTKFNPERSSWRVDGLRAIDDKPANRVTLGWVVDTDLEPERWPRRSRGARWIPYLYAPWPKEGRLALDPCGSLSDAGQQLRAAYNRTRATAP